MRKLPSIVTREEFEKLYSYLIDLEKKSSKKRRIKLKQYRLAILLGFEAGLRISEIVGYSNKVPPLAKSSVDNISIKVVSGKGKKDRIVPRPRRMNTKSIEMLPLQVHRRSLQHFITDIGRVVLQKHITFHSLRHGFGSHLAGEGRPLHEIQMLMGHARLDTTGIYLHANPKRAVEGARNVF